jgi:hypothetical protein
LYAASVSDDSDRQQAIHTDDHAFHAPAIHFYKQVVTHYLTCKMELWLALFANPMYGLINPMGVMEFAKTRGAIHWHLLACAQPGSLQDPIDATMAAWASSVFEAVTTLEAYLDGCAEDASALIGTPDDPRMPPGPGALEASRRFLALSEGGRAVWDAYEAAMEAAQATAGVAIGEVLTSQVGVNALHPGQVPSEWPRPGGLPAQGYCSTWDGMQSNADILEKAELKQFKFTCEFHLYDRHVNLTNHCRTHCCSGYCLKASTFSVAFDPAQGHMEDDPTMYTHSRTGQRMVVASMFVCCFGFGKSLPYDPCGDGNLMWGIPRQDAPSVLFDANGQPRFHAIRNHPRVVQEPVGMNWYGANCDLVPMLTNHLTRAQHKAHYPQFLNALALAGVSGLDQYHGAETAENYIVAYKCKGSESLAAWESVLRSIGAQYVSSD